ncbi:hydrogenase maturation protease [Anaerohalosphaera lusitana]|nr:hydrogenase maturation protease [Anaerohalosphaera lusitana]
MGKDTIVIGLGNPLMCDEGIGITLIEYLTKKQDEHPDVDFIDAGTGGMQLLHYISGRKKAVLIDCAFMGTEPGTIKRFTADEVKSIKKLSHLSLHEVDILKVIELSEQLGEAPDEVVFFGIEPAAVEDGMELSDTLAGKIDDYLQTIDAELGTD